MDCDVMTDECLLSEGRGGRRKEEGKSTVRRQYLKCLIFLTILPIFRDVVYRSILHTYVEQLLKRNSNLLFFLEGS